MSIIVIIIVVTTSIEEDESRTIIHHRHTKTAPRSTHMLDMTRLELFEFVGGRLDRHGGAEKLAFSSLRVEVVIVVDGGGGGRSGGGGGRRVRPAVGAKGVAT